MAVDLVSRLEAYRAEEQQLAWRGTFKEYFDLVVESPRTARLSHARVFDMLVAGGSETLPNGDKKHNFFADELFGIEKPLQHLVDYFASAARRLEVRKRILLLMGPVGGGKSTIVSMLKRGLEEYSRADDGAIYAIAGCPMHEEPLHLLPESIRKEVREQHGIYIEGDLCPRCRMLVDEQYGGRIEDVEIRRIAFSEKKRVGIGTFSLIVACLQYRRRLRVLGADRIRSVGNLAFVVACLLFLLGLSMFVGILSGSAPFG